MGMDELKSNYRQRVSRRNTRRRLDSRTNTMKSSLNITKKFSQLEEVLEARKVESQDSFKNDSVLGEGLNDILNPNIKAKNVASIVVSVDSLRDIEQKHKEKNKKSNKLNFDKTNSVDESGIFKIYPDNDSNLSNKYNDNRNPFRTEVPSFASGTNFFEENIVRPTKQISEKVVDTNKFFGESNQNDKTFDFVTSQNQSRLPTFRKNLTKKSNKDEWGDLNLPTSGLTSLVQEGLEIDIGRPSEDGNQSPLKR